MLRYNTQNDINYKNEIMTEPPYKNGSKQKHPDIIGDIGCGVASLANIIQLTVGHEFTPKDCNDWLRNNKGYSYLALGKNCPVGQESFILWDVVARHWAYKITNIEKNEQGLFVDYARKYNRHYIARFKYCGYDHFSNVIESELISGEQWFEIYNVWNGEMIVLPARDITYLKEFTNC